MTLISLKYMKAFSLVVSDNALRATVHLTKTNDHLTSPQVVMFINIVAQLGRSLNRLSGN